MPFSTLVSTQFLAEHLDDPDWSIFDCRFVLADPGAGERAYREGHIPGARYAHLERDLSSPVIATSGRHPLPDPRALARRLGAWSVDENTQVVVYDDTGGAMAGRMWWLLRWLGHKPVALLDGGIMQWLREGRPLGTELREPATKAFTARADNNQWLDTQQVQEGLGAGALRLLDARGEARFRGEEEPIDPVAGHIPGALNRPFQRNLGSDGRFLPSEVLRHEFRQLLGDIRSATVVHMCGSGVTACHNLLAMEIAGLSGSRLYPGSWSEWIRDPARQRAKD